MKQFEMYQKTRAQKDYSNDFLPKKRTQRDYSDEFKIMIVREFEQGCIKMSDLCRKYGIQSHSTVTNWINQYNPKILTDTLKNRVKDVELENKFLKQQILILSKRR